MDGAIRRGVQAEYTPIGKWEITVTNEFKLYGNLLTRLEFRHDGSTRNIFGNSNGFADYQDTVALEAICLF